MSSIDHFESGRQACKDGKSPLDYPHYLNETERLAWADGYDFEVESEIDEDDEVLELNFH